VFSAHPELVEGRLLCSERAAVRRSRNACDPASDPLSKDRSSFISRPRRLAWMRAGALRQAQGERKERGERMRALRFPPSSSTGFDQGERKEVARAFVSRFHMSTTSVDQPKFSAPPGVPSSGLKYSRKPWRSMSSRLAARI